MPPPPAANCDDMTVDVVKREITNRRIFDTLKVVRGLEVEPGDQVELLERLALVSQSPRLGRS